MLKRYRIVWISLMLVSTLGGSCSNHTQIKEKEVMKTQAEIYFAGGCFWGTEHFMKQIAGVYATQTGYANGTVENRLTNRFVVALLVLPKPCKWFTIRNK